REIRSTSAPPFATRSRSRGNASRKVWIEHVSAVRRPIGGVAHVEQLGKAIPRMRAVGVVDSRALDLRWAEPRRRYERRRKEERMTHNARRWSLPGTGEGPA